MNDRPASRFVARKDARGTWMVWDRERRGPAEPQRASAGLTETAAKELAEKLTNTSPPDPRLNKATRALSQPSHDALYRGILPIPRD